MSETQKKALERIQAVYNEATPVGQERLLTYAEGFAAGARAVLASAPAEPEQTDTEEEVGCDG